MIKRTIPPHAYKGKTPPFKFLRFEECGDKNKINYIHGILMNGKSIVIPKAEWWVED